MRMIRRFLSSAKLAMTLLVAILVCCVSGVTIFRGQQAGALIFGTLWFNALLVLLVVNVGFCFFGRMWGRKLTLVFLGMILFHLSFVAILGGIIYNSLFRFEGLMRLTEGETLPNGDIQSYDLTTHGRFFDSSKLRGETTLIKMHAGYRVGDENKKAAYEISVGEGNVKKQGRIYLTQNLDYHGFTYLPDREGFSILAILYDKQGREIYGAHIPLQSFRQQNNTYVYTTGTKDSPGSFMFPQGTSKPLFQLQITYQPDLKKERAGDVFFRVWPLETAQKGTKEKPLAEGKAPVGGKVKAGDYYLSAEEVRYWVGMKVRYDPGKPIVLTSLWVGLAGIVMTTIGRMRRKK